MSRNLHLRAYSLIITLSIPIFIFAMWFSGCLDDKGPTSPVILNVNIFQESPLVFRIEIVLDEPSSLSVTYGREGNEELEVRSESVSSTHSLLLSRLVAESRYFVIIDSGREILEREVLTDPLPDDLAAIDFNTAGLPTYPLTLMKLFHAEGYRGYGIINSDGDIVWFYRTEGRASGATKRANGNFVFIDSAIGLVEVSPTAQMVSQLIHESVSGRIHHDVISTPSGTVWFIAQDTQSVGGHMVVGEAIWEWIPETGETQKLWSSFDHLDPDSDWGTRSQPENWLHVNALSMGPRDNLLISSHFLNQIISISSDFQSLEWRLGGVNATIEVDDGERFSGQHTPSETEPGHVLLFDNGFERGGYSRAVEFRIENGRASKKWEFRPGDDNWARIISSAWRLTNGNSFICFGLSEDAAEGGGSIEVYEVTAGNQVVFYMKTKGMVWSMYRATPLDRIAGEREIIH